MLKMLYNVPFVLGSPEVLPCWGRMEILLLAQKEQTGLEQHVLWICPDQSLELFWFQFWFIANIPTDESVKLSECSR